MPTNEQNLAIIRRRLGHPLPESPDDGTLLTMLVDQIAHHTTQLSVTRNHWAVDHWTLTLMPGVEDYPIAAANFGRPFLLYTVDPSDQYHVRREIPFSMLQDIDRRYSGAERATPSSINQHTANQVSFYRKEGQGWFVRPTPIPGSVAQYELWYETNYNYGSMGDTPGLECFHHLLRVQTALSALPYCEWPGLSPKDNPESWKGWQAKINMIKEALLHDEMLFRNTFNSYKAQASRDGVTSKLGYAPDADIWPFGGGYMPSGYGV